MFGTPVVSDGISMGTEAMKYSLVSREVIADAIELMTEGYQVDGVITLSGCDKTIPAALMPIARNDLTHERLFANPRCHDCTDRVTISLDLNTRSFR